MDKRWISQLFQLAKSNRFSAQLLRSFIFMSIVPIIITSFISYILCYKAILDNSISVSHEMNDYAAEEINKIQKVNKNIASTLLHSSEVQLAMRYTSKSDASSNLISEYHINSSLKSIKDSATTNLSGIYCISANGTCYQSNTTAGTASKLIKDYSSKSWYREVIQQEKETWFLPHEESYIKDYKDAYLIGYGIPYVDYITQKPDGVILIESDVTSFFSVLNNDDKLGASTYYVLDNDENIIYSANNTSDIFNLKLKDLEKRNSHIYINTLDNGWKIVGVISKSKISVAAIRQLSIAIMIMLVGSVILGIAMSVKQSKEISSPINRMIANMKIVQKGNYDVEIPIPESSDEIIELYKNFNTMIYKSNQYMDQIKEEQENLRIANFKALQAQINPHFLYNTLDTIVWNIRMNKNEKAIESIMTLTKFFRASLQKGADIVTLEQEMNQVTLYFEIQSYRYDDMLDYSIEYDESLSNCEIPKLSLQPIIENAIYHGIKYKDGYGHIDIRTERMKNQYKIIVTDNGQGMTSEKVTQINEALKNRKIIESSESGGYGIYNVDARIKTYFGTEYGLKYYSKENQYTRVEMILPILVKQEEYYG